MSFVGPWGLKPMFVPLVVKPRIGGPVGSSGVMPIPSSPAVGSFLAGAAWKLLFRWPVSRKSFSSEGENFDIDAQGLVDLELFRLRYRFLKSGLFRRHRVGADRQQRSLIITAFIR